MADKVTSSAVSKSRRKLAFIVGINDYDYVTKLTNAEKDAKALSSVLRTIGFGTIEALGKQTGRLEIKRKFDEFEGLIEPNDMVLFYFAGHGMQLDTKNYLIPKDCPGLDDNDIEKTARCLKTKAISAQDILDGLAEREPYVIIFLLDCCRQNVLETPSTEKRRSMIGNKSKSGGLAPMNKAGSLIAFACAPGAFVDDRWQQENGLFMKHLLQHITKPNEDIINILRDVTDGVMNESKLYQIPYLSVQLRHKNVYLCEQIIGKKEIVFDGKDEPFEIYFDI